MCYQNYLEEFQGNLECQFLLTYLKLSNYPHHSANSEVQVSIFSPGWHNSLLISLLAPRSALLQSVLKSELSFQKNVITSALFCFVFFLKPCVSFQLLWGTEIKILNLAHQARKPAYFYLPTLIPNTPTLSRPKLKLPSSNVWKVMSRPIRESAMTSSQPLIHN